MLEIVKPVNPEIGELWLDVLRKISNLKGYRIDKEDSSNINTVKNCVNDSIPAFSPNYEDNSYLPA